ncbi:UDP-N-acetylmuramoyl-L-alanyl-D-glutamate--2,6-diaminopimelate ligase [Polluticoccus soli]|uniref:UDP-N-acetylmuramoyl-L-alanyl-D-glutamate--2, 6-diaminopimelate ligase n=1 Tax=Polluticoccus soli TaxID=3034150 RepID=UPI0023E2B849|nr:UDP-N-acetylmuramoyl-L-alanyl-D-glutamate--2,6-diaminopimelate ligase [Flavipsychrobacter sp. JY13-12]
MVTLKDILLPLQPVKTVGDTSVEVKSIAIDSRKVQQGTVFVAVKGTAVDGHQFIEKAIELGAVAVVCETMPSSQKEGVAYVQVKDTAETAGLMADAFYGNPSMQVKVVGVTGTNGKTTVATLLYRLFSGLGYKCGLISTVQNHIGDEVEVSTHTTPDAISVQSLLARMAEAKCQYVFMEVSSHAVHQRRIAGLKFAGALFTNITHDHLDYHKTFDEYIRVKKRFFDDLGEDAFALTNADDKRGSVMLQNTKAEKNAYSLKAPATFKGKILENNLTGLVMTVDNHEAHFRMIGTFNAYNLLAVYGAAVLLGEDKMKVLSVLSDLHGAPGRFETYMSPNDKVLGIVDYAHTPDALINVLATINQLRTKGQQVITVVGCGGDRDKAKRPIMAEVACEHSDRVILTADNPRSEDPEAILNEMEAGLTAAHRRKMLRITDRREAIKTACALAQPDDILLIAGKGHETYQEIKGVKTHFDDREVLTEAFKTLNK